jgi:hypothetical protein
MPLPSRNELLCRVSTAFEGADEGEQNLRVFYLLADPRVASWVDVTSATLRGFILVRTNYPRGSKPARPFLENMDKTSLAERNPGQALSPDLAVLGITQTSPGQFFGIGKAFGWGS